MPQNPKSVCIIDDDSMYVNLVSKVIELKKLSEKIIVFNNGKEALDYFVKSAQKEEDKTVPQVIFLDLNMPVMDGWQFLQEFERIKDNLSKKIDVYVVSSSIDIRDINRAKSIALVSDYLTKPIQIDDFKKILV
ncbi:two-component system response regulator [Aquimarina sp. SS2-1]|uniref:response regulator n=1 Tax=Aquimarina besae TaxID=3342247 RepID=UPI00367342E8